MNDATRLANMFQGHGGFGSVLDPRTNLLNPIHKFVDPSQEV